VTTWTNGLWSHIGHTVFSESLVKKRKPPAPVKTVDPQDQHVAAEQSGSPEYDQGAVNDVRDAVKTAFVLDRARRDALAENLREPSLSSQELVARAQKAFANFDASRHLPDRRARLDYVEPGGDLAKAQTHVITEGLQLRSEMGNGGSMTLAFSDGLRELMTTEPTPDSRAATIDLSALVAYVEARSVASGCTATDSALARCKAETEAEERLKQIRGEDGAAQGSPAASGGAAVHGGTDPAKPDPAIAALSPADLVERLVDLQIQTMSPPESELRYAIPSESDQIDKVHNKPSFELRTGPTDVVAYHDFHSLQIAFEGVWTEIIDARLGALGRELYQEYVKIKQVGGIDTGSDRQIASVADLKQLMDDIRELSRLTAENIPPGFSPEAGPNGSAGAATGIPDVSSATGNDASGTRRNTRNPGGELTWDSFGPGELYFHDKISLNIDLHALNVAPGQMEIQLKTAKILHGDRKAVALTDLSNHVYTVHVEGQAYWEQHTTLPIASALGGIFDFWKNTTLGDFHAVYWLEGITKARFTPTDDTRGIRVTFTWEFGA
jgi:hypothetical protein